MTKLQILTIGLTALAAITIADLAADSDTRGDKTVEKTKKDTVMTDKTNKNDTDLKTRLTPEQYRVTQQCGTEPPFTGKYYKHKENGMYHCVVCDNPLFKSETKYESGSGWPSFWAPVTPDAVKYKTDNSHGMIRT